MIIILQCVTGAYTKTKILLLLLLIVYCAEVCIHNISLFICSSSKHHVVTINPSSVTFHPSTLTSPTGNMTGNESTKYERIPADEAETHALGSANLDDIKSEFI